MSEKQERAFAAWQRAQDPRTYPAERQAFEAGWAAALQSQDREDALRYRWLRQAGVDYSTDIDVVDAEGCCLNGEELDVAIDHARRFEGKRDGL